MEPRRQVLRLEFDVTEDVVEDGYGPALLCPLYSVRFVEIGVPRAVFWVPAVPPDSLLNLLRCVALIVVALFEVRLGDVPFQSRRRPPQ